MYYSNTQSVESYQTEDCPVKGLSFDNTTDIETQPPLFFVKESSIFQRDTFDAGSSKRWTCQEEIKVSSLREATYLKQSACGVKINELVYLVWLR